jgi:hypothetical protein
MAIMILVDNLGQASLAQATESPKCKITLCHFIWLDCYFVFVSDFDDFCFSYFSSVSYLVIHYPELWVTIYNPCQLWPTCKLGSLYLRTFFIFSFLKEAYNWGQREYVLILLLMLCNFCRDLSNNNLGGTIPYSFPQQTLQHLYVSIAYIVLSCYFCSDIVIPNNFVTLLQKSC